MGVGTSIGAYYDDEFHHATAKWDPKYDNNVVTPPQMDQNKQLDQVENDDLGGIPVSMTDSNDPFWNNVPQDQIARLSRQPSNILPPQAHDPFVGGSITPSGTSQMRSPANDNKNLQIDSPLADSIADSLYDQSFVKKTDPYDAAVEKQQSKPQFKVIEGGGNAPEKIKSPALNIRGEIAEGMNHADAMEAYTDAHPGHKAFHMVSEGGLTAKEWEAAQGYTTTHGRFVSRQEGAKIANEQDQLNTKNVNPNVLMSEDLDLSPSP